ncbi:hypothetical protein [Streptomyces sp. GESEQ-35]|uniref:hypothetical protein n=1 Tax=Streptomyces sp. GESEQ-35 TaxID=2812657 RepID=UPI001B31D85E|nr:hypothetical protein [Streptomyces sp. GESEQ-35]
MRDVNRAARPNRLPHAPNERYMRSLSEAARKYHIDADRAYLQAVTNEDGSVASRRRMEEAAHDKEYAAEQRLLHGWAYESMVADWLCAESPHHRDRIAARLSTVSIHLARPMRELH